MLLDEQLFWIMTTVLGLEVVYLLDTYMHLGVTTIRLDA